MANIKSAKKRTKINAKKNTENRSARSELASAIKKFRAAALMGNLAEVERLFPSTVSIIDSAASSGIIHPNNASNKVSAISKLLNDVRSGKIQPVAPPVKKERVKKNARKTVAAEVKEDAVPAAEPKAEEPKAAPAKKPAAKKAAAPKAE